jgi:hypothetical protein
MFLYPGTISMNRFLACLSALLLTPLAMGCVTCDSPFDNQYTATGGSIQRADGDTGRVNSAFVPTALETPAEDNSQAPAATPAAYIHPAARPFGPLLDEPGPIYYGPQVITWPVPER